MSLEQTARAELLRMRRHKDGVTVAALARTEALRRLLGGGDPRVAYNTLKHILLVNTDDLSVIAASYSLGFASEGKTHLDRLNDFGAEYTYDQRQARRYSDKGIVEMARYIASEWTIEASPTLEVAVLRADDDVLELDLRTERPPFIEMGEPLVETVGSTGNRTLVPCGWSHDDNGEVVRGASNVVVRQDASSHVAVSIRWEGEIWPRFVVTTAPVGAARGVRSETLGSRVQFTLDRAST